MKRRSRDSAANLTAAAEAPAAPAKVPSPEPPPAKRARRRSSLTGGEEPPSIEKVTEDVLVSVPPVIAPTPTSTSSGNNKKQKASDKKQGSATASVASSSVVSAEVSPRSTVSASASVNNAANEKLDSQPFSVNNCLVVKYRDNSHRLAKIIEFTKKEEGSGYHYYVHYFDFNRRMDEWIDENRIISFPSVANPMEAQYAHHHHGAQKKDENNAADEEANIHINDHSNNKNDSMLTTIAELEHDEHEGLDEAQLKEHEQITKVKNIQTVQLGKYSMECWYFSPFPKEFYAKGFAECLYFCEYSLRFFATKDELLRFQRKGFAEKTLPLHPPGHEIYRDETLSMFELDGSIERIYCQNLCYFAKLFLDHKTLFWDVDAFLFYVLCTRDSRGFHPVGYFSKEKYSDLGYNLACILTFPCVQRQGYGRFLIEFSYELSKKEDKFGSPEKPLSDLGALGYKSYWSATLVRLLRDKIAQAGGVDYITIADLSCLTSIQPEDIIATLQYLGLLVPLQEYLAKQQSNNLLTSSSSSDGNNALGLNGRETSLSNEGDELAPSMDVDDDTNGNHHSTTVTPTEDATKQVTNVSSAPPTTATATATKNRQPPQLRRHHQQKQQALAQKQAAASANNAVHSNPTTSNAASTSSVTVVSSTPAKAPPSVSTHVTTSTTNTTNTSNVATTEESYVLLCDVTVLEELAKMYPEGQCRVQPHRLHWTPFYVMDAKKDKWNLYHLRQAAQSNPQTCHVLPFLQQEQQQQQQQLQQQQSLLPTVSSQGTFMFSGLTRNLSMSLFAGESNSSASAGVGIPTLSRQTTLLLNNSMASSTNNNGYNLFSRLSTPNFLSLGNKSASVGDKEGEMDTISGTAGQ